MIVFFAILTFAIAADLLSKYFLTEVYSDFIPRFLSIYYTENRGAAFSWFYGHTAWLIAISSILTLAALAYYIWQRRIHKLRGQRSGWVFNIGFAFFLGGAIGNLFDRIWLGYVRDFLRFEFMNFPIFNLADVFINIGVIMILVHIIFLDGKKKTRPVTEHYTALGESSIKNSEQSEED